MPQHKFLQKLRTSFVGKLSQFDILAAAHHAALFAANRNSLKKAHRLIGKFVIPLELEREEFQAGFGLAIPLLQLAPLDQRQLRLLDQQSFEIAKGHEIAPRGRSSSGILAQSNEQDADSIPR